MHTREPFLDGWQGKYFEAVCHDINPEERTLVACFPAEAGLDEACFKVPYDMLILGDRWCLAVPVTVSTNQQAINQYPGTGQSRNIIMLITCFWVRRVWIRPSGGCSLAESGNSSLTMQHFTHNASMHPEHGGLWAGAAVGSSNNTFGIKGVEDHCFFFRSITNANELRRRVSECFERAALPQCTREVP